MKLHETVEIPPCDKLSRPSGASGESSCSKSWPQYGLLGGLPRPKHDAATTWLTLANYDSKQKWLCTSSTGPHKCEGYWLSEQRSLLHQKHARKKMWALKKCMHLHIYIVVCNCHLQKRNLLRSSIIWAAASVVSPKSEKGSEEYLETWEYSAAEMQKNSSFSLFLTLNKSLCAPIQMVTESFVLQSPHIGKVLCFSSQSSVPLCQRGLEVVGMLWKTFLPDEKRKTFPSHWKMKQQWLSELIRASYSVHKWKKNTF